jgi:hypothetical protein
MIATEEGSDFRTRNTGLLRAAGRGPWRVVDGPGSARQIIRAALCCAAAAHVPTRRGLPGRGSFFFFVARQPPPRRDGFARHRPLRHWKKGFTEAGETTQGSSSY